MERVAESRDRLLTATKDSRMPDDGYKPNNQLPVVHKPMNEWPAIAAVPRRPVPELRGRDSAGWPRFPSASQKISASAIVQAFGIPLIAMVLRIASSGTANASYILVALYAMTGPRQAIVSLYLCWLFNMINHGLAPAAGYAAILRHLVILCAFISVMVHSKRGTSARTGILVPATLVLCGFLIVHSMIFSHQSDISLLKAISFSLTVTALTVGWGTLEERERQITMAFLFGSLGLIAVISIPFVTSTIGYFKNGRGFQGVLVHPQNFGPTMAVLAALLVGQGLTEKKLRFWKVFLLGLSILWIFLSQARIGGLAFVLSLVLGIGCNAIMTWMERNPSRNPLRLGRLTWATALVLIAGIAAAPFVGTRVSTFIQKGARSESLSDIAMASRGGKINEMMVNIRQYPIFGTGFGVLLGSDYFAIQRDPILGLPIMATVEKGVMPVAIVEETGIVGACITFPWLLLLLVRSVRGGLISGIVFWSVLATNIAEACFFSPGGQGMFQLIFAIWAATSPQASVIQPVVLQRRQRHAA